MSKRNRNPPSLTRTLRYGSFRFAKFMHILTVIGKLAFNWGPRRAALRPAGLHLWKALERRCGRPRFVN